MLDVRWLRSALIVAPHADDEVLGVGGLIARLTRSGCDVHVIYACVDGMKHYGTDHETTVAERQAEIEKVKDALGFSYSILYRGQNLIERLDTVPQRELVDAYEHALNERRPDILCLPHGVDFDQDHVACFRAAFAAARPIPCALGKHLVPCVVSYEMPKLTWSAEAFHPNLYVDITAELELKLAALALYRTQFRQTPHVRSVENIRSLARLRGSDAGVDYAEAFRVHRWIL